MLALRNLLQSYLIIIYIEKHPPFQIQDQQG